MTKQLTDFREGNRTNDGDAMTMRTIAGKLSNHDIEALASYIGACTEAITGGALTFS